MHEGSFFVCWTDFRWWRSANIDMQNVSVEFSRTLDPAKWREELNQVTLGRSTLSEGWKFAAQKVIACNEVCTKVFIAFGFLKVTSSSFMPVKQLLWIDKSSLTLASSSANTQSQLARRAWRSGRQTKKDAQMYPPGRSVRDIVDVAKENKGQESS